LSTLAVSSILASVASFVGSVAAAWASGYGLASKGTPATACVGSPAAFASSYWRTAASWFLFALSLFG